MTVLALAAVLCAAPQSPAPEIDDAAFAAWREHIVPRPAELRWESIPWRTTFAEGLTAASAQRRPLLFWGMNGHPLGCT